MRSFRDRMRRSWESSDFNIYLSIRKMRILSAINNFHQSSLQMISRE